MALRYVQLSALGGAMLYVLMDGGIPGTPPTRQDLDQWIAAPPIAYTAVMENPARPDSLVGYYSADKEHYLIYRLPTMELVSHTLYNAIGALDTLEGLLRGPDGGAAPDGGGP